MWGDKTLRRFICPCPNFIYHPTEKDSLSLVVFHISKNSIPSSIHIVQLLQWHFRSRDFMNQWARRFVPLSDNMLYGWLVNESKLRASTQEGTSLKRRNFTFCRLVWIWKHVWLISRRIGCSYVRRSQVSPFVGLRVIGMISADTSELMGL